MVKVEHIQKFYQGFKNSPFIVFLGFEQNDEAFPLAGWKIKWNLNKFIFSIPQKATHIFTGMELDPKKLSLYSRETRMLVGPK